LNSSREDAGPSACQITLDVLRFVVGISVRSNRTA